MKPITLTQEQQRQYSQMFNAEMEKVTMRWDNELREWHPIALDALQYTSSAEMRLPQKDYSKLLETEVTGINMNIVALLSNNLEGRTPAQMGYSIEGWAEVLVLNNRVATRWQALAADAHEKLNKFFHEQNNKARILAGTGAGLQLIKGEA